MRMPDVREVYEMVIKQKPVDPGALERQHTRQVRTMRNRKVGAIAVAAAIGAAALVFAFASSGDESTTKTGNGSTTASPTPEEVARGFMEAFGAFDANRVIGYLADDADVSALISSVGEVHDGPGLRLSISWLEAVGYEQILDACDELSTSPSGSVVRCSFALHLLRSGEIGRGPFGGGSLDLTVRDGKIDRASSMSWDFEKEFSPQVWEPFVEWVSTTYPQDAAVMYADGSYSSVRLSDASIRLWERHTKGYVRYVEKQADGP
jgi:hypothetical protein